MRLFLLALTDKSKSCCRVQSSLYFFQRPPLCFHDITSYVQDSKKTDTRKSQIHRADAKLVYNTQEIKANDEVWNLKEDNENKVKILVIDEEKRWLYNHHNRKMHVQAQRRVYVQMNTYLHRDTYAYLQSQWITKKVVLFVVNSFVRQLILFFFFCFGLVNLSTDFLIDLNLA